MTIYTFIPVIIYFVTLLIAILGRKRRKANEASGKRQRSCWKISTMEVIPTLIGAAAIVAFAIIIGRLLPVTIWTFEGWMTLIGVGISAGSIVGWIQVQLLAD